MTMRIDPISRAYEVYKSQKVTPAKKINSVSSKDQVEFSSIAKEFGSVYKMAFEAPEVRKDKVESLKEQIKSGTYNVKSEEVAEKIMSQFDIKG